MIDKSRVVAAIVAQLQADLDLQMRAALLARDEATSEESKAENKYDTRAQEAAYLAEGQARQAAELRESISLYAALPLPQTTESAAVAVGHLVKLDGGGRTLSYFLGPRAGGAEVQVDGELITVVTPASPLGRQLLGARVGATVMLPGRGKTQALRVAAIV
ncbi:MAG TPA: transcription elongation factor [Candidatus Synoicihabitans sp.]|nr:transcription elongation factor [Candidatus Synoicihabitans sp.]